MSYNYYPLPTVVQYPEKLNPINDIGWHVFSYNNPTTHDWVVKLGRRHVLSDNELDLRDKSNLVALRSHLTEKVRTAEHELQRLSCCGLNIPYTFNKLGMIDGSFPDSWLDKKFFEGTPMIATFSQKKEVIENHQLTDQERERVVQESCHGLLKLCRSIVDEYREKGQIASYMYDIFDPKQFRLTRSSGEQTVMMLDTEPLLSVKPKQTFRYDLLTFQQTCDKFDQYFNTGSTAQNFLRKYSAVYRRIRQDFVLL